ncbi:Smr/MutS family protein [Pseudoxanthomonas sp. PXM02]|uniref:Smr/MutS family protein n=1 Tax=Pseudoxanthomonas sp. PXM02 TaxID=2769294 RepID=UPI00177E0FA2|nr:Smr/MutS family protein [Pseudoxanthomonas sp. PXM02]MBD9478144.1 Smr/MutS family protein [Pseudoxanthomonas sp. PXM02]
MSNATPPDDDDAALFRDAIGEVRRLQAAPAPPRKAPPRPAARMAERDESDARNEFQRGLDALDLHAAGDVLSYRREALSPRAFQRLKRGQFSVQDELDLHGATALQAEGLLRRFLADAHAHDHGCVRVIHGKGQRSDGDAPVLKNLVDRLLRQRSDVMAFHSAPPTQGGTGAVLVLLAHR